MNFWSEMMLHLNSTWVWFHFVLGAIVGSFLNVCILRIPEGTFWRNTRSVCPFCESPVRWYNNIPILNFIWLRGRAACCGQKLSWQYPIVEFITAIIFAGVFLKFPYITGDGPDLAISWPDGVRFFHLSIFCSLMLVCSLIDLRHMIIPDSISLSMLALTPVIVFYHPELTWKSALFGVLFGGGLLYGVAWLYWLLRREIGLGFGDVKLLAAIGGWLGVQSILPTILVGSISGTFFGLAAIIIGRKVSMKTALPFGPFLAFGACLHMFYDFHLFH